MKKTIIAALAVFLTGCAASTPQEARDMGPERHYAFTVNEDYQTVYRRLVDMERKCYQGAMLTAAYVVNSDLYPDRKTATISVGLYGIAAAVYQVIDLRGVDGSTQVTATFPVGPVEKFGRMVRGYATGSQTQC